MEEQEQSPQARGAAKRPPGGYSKEHKLAILKALAAWKGTKDAFYHAHGVPQTSLWAWGRAFKARGEAGLDKGMWGKGKKEKKKSYATPEAKRKAVEAFAKSGESVEDFGKIWGVSGRVLSRWLKQYREGGPKALEGRGGRKKGRKPLAPALIEQIVNVKSQFPEFGLRKVRDFMARFKGLKASTHQIRRVAKEEKLPAGKVPTRRWKKKAVVRRFERAKPGEMWQSDITSFNLTRYSLKVYLVAFVDDHSRYVVSWKLGLRQTQELVNECLLEGIQRFGKPKEVLTDQGRQYFAWRGMSDFQKLLEKQGIAHVI